MTPDQVNAYINALLANGALEVGLEVGADPGLSPRDYIKIPKVMGRKATIPGVPAAEGKGKGRAQSVVPDDPAPKWVMVHDGKLYEATTTDNIRYVKGRVLPSIAVEHPTSWHDEIRAFVAANSESVRSQEFAPEVVQKIHAIRYWAVKTGMVVSSKSHEYTIVENPTPEDMTAVPADTVELVARYAGQAMTACVARTASWRKSNHATGGGNDGVATGLPRRWMTREGMWSQDQDRNRRLAANRTATSAFYVATHAVSVHSVLALMLPGASEHFTVVKPSYGLLQRWDLRESARVRLAPNTQVAGASMVTDAVEVAKMLISEGYTPFLSNAMALRALMASYNTVKQEGMRVAVYANWFFSGHPMGDRYSRVPFNQKDSSFAALVGELGVVATKFYRGMTISDSPALANAASQLASAQDQAKWSQLGRFRTGAASITALKAFGRITGASAGAAIEDLTSDDDEVLKAAVKTYNDVVAGHAEMYGVGTYAQASYEQVSAGKGSADRKADEMSQMPA